MSAIDQTIERLSEELYWRYKDIWDGYVPDELSLFKNIKESSQKDLILYDLNKILIWKDCVAKAEFFQKTKKISILADFKDRNMSFEEWLSWAYEFLQAE